MKTKLLIILLFAFGISSKAQNSFSKQFPAAGTFSGLVNSSDSGFVICGEDVFLKVDNSGNFIWGKACSIYYSKICRTNDSCYMLAGSNSLTTGIICIKFNEQGDTVWTTSISLPHNAVVSKIIQSEDSTFLIIGKQTNNTAPYSQMFMAKVDADGTFLWKKNYTGANYENKLTGIQEDQDHNYYVCGGLEFHSGNFSIKGVLMKLTPSGDILWNRVFNDTTVTGVSMSDIYLLHAGILCSLNENIDQIIIKTDWDGNLLWANRSNSIYNQMLPDFVPGFQKKNENDFLLSCNSNNISELDSSGQSISLYTSLWGLPIDGYINTFSQGIAHVATGFSGTCIVSDDSLYTSSCLISLGPYNSTPTTFITDSVTILVDSDGVQSYIPISLADITLFSWNNCPDIEYVQENTAHHQIRIYPNPSNGGLSFDFSDKTIPDMINIFDLNGKLMVKFKPYKAIEQFILPNDFQPGVYTCCFQYPDVRITKKVVVVK